MRNAIIALLLLTASATHAQFGGGGCPSGGFVDRYSGQEVSGEKAFCSTATFKTGFILGLNPANTLGLTALQAPTSPLYWGNRQICDSSGNCPGGGGGGGVGGGGTIGKLPIWSTTFTITDSAISQNTGLERIILDNYYSLVMMSTNTLQTNFKASGVSSNGIFNLEANGNLTLQSQAFITIQTPTGLMMHGALGAEVFSGDDLNLEASDKIYIDGSGGIDVLTNGNLNMTVNGNFILNGQTGASGSFNGLQGSCPGGQNEYITFQKGIIMFWGCH